MGPSKSAPNSVTIAKISQRNMERGHIPKGFQGLATAPHRLALARNTPRAEQPLHHTILQDCTDERRVHTRRLAALDDSRWQDSTSVSTSDGDVATADQGFTVREPPPPPKTLSNPMFAGSDSTDWAMMFQGGRNGHNESDEAEGTFEAP